MRTEDVDPRFAGFDAWPAEAMIAALVEGQLAAAAAANAARPALAAAATAAAARLEDPAGRLIYAGAGASGRLAAQDGAELHPTFGWPHDRLVVLMAGGEAALVRSVEGAEDDADGARAAVAALGPGPADVLIAVAASGRTPWTVAAAEAAAAAGALTVGLANATPAPLLASVAHPVALPTGAEVIAGSTRMAAGTAQKIAMNALSTAVMARLGRVHDNLMVALSSSNAKLDARRAAIVARIAGTDDAAARAALARADGCIRLAVLLLRGLDPPEARARLAQAGGRLREALR